jgi:hypothetical protein
LGIIEGRLAEVGTTFLRLELAGGQKVDCSIDGRTYVDRDRSRLSLKDLKIGDLLELVTERHGPQKACFARMIHVATGGLRFGGRLEVGQITRATETISPRGNVNLAGVVRDLQQASLELRTKQDGVFRLRLRPDTSYVREGIRVGREDLKANLRVSIRCGYTLDGELEAYQIIWGGILPRTSAP